MNTGSLPRAAPFPTSCEGLSVGTVLKDTYRIVRPLAEGGCGEVYVATHLRLSSQVAVKALHRSLAGDVQALTRFRQEAEVTSVLRHPHIVQLFDFDVTEQGIPYLVMELLDGRSLSDRLVVDTPMDPSSAVHVVEQIAEALQVAHGRGVVHRDLKPENVILLSVDGRDFVKVLDFGISQASWRTRLTGEAIVAGTPRYMAPEQARGLRDQIDHRADQFSLAAMSYRLLTGREPFSGEEPAAVLYQVVHEAPRPPSEVAPSLNPAVDAVIGRGMSKQAEERYPDIRTFAKALAAAIEGTEARMETHAPSFTPPTAAADPPGRVTMRLIRRTRRKIRSRARGSMVLALAAAVVFAWFCPATRNGTRGAWQRVRADAGRLIEMGHALTDR